MRREGEDCGEGNGVCGSQGWEERQQDLGRGKNKPHQRVYKVAFASPEGVSHGL